MDKRSESSRKPKAIAGILAVGLLYVGMASAQVFQPRTNQPAPPVPMPGQATPVPTPSAPVPKEPGPPGSRTSNIPFAAILGDPTKAFIQIANLRGPMESNFVLGRGLLGRINLERHIHEAGNGNKIFLHVNGLSNPPTVSTENNELHYQFLFPSIQFKTYYKEYTGEGDGALGDVQAEKVTVDIYFTPAVDQRKLPTYQAVRVVFTGEIKEPDKCTYFFDVIFPVNVCSLAKDYLKNIKPVIENGIREGLQQPQTRGQFEQAVWQQLRGELLQQAGLNPASPAQVHIVEAGFKGTDYVVSYLPRP